MSFHLLQVPHSFGLKLYVILYCFISPLPPVWFFFFFLATCLMAESSCFCLIQLNFLRSPPKTRHQDQLWASEVSLLAVPKALSWFQEAKVKRAWSELGRIHLNLGKKARGKKYRDNFLPPVPSCIRAFHFRCSEHRCRRKGTRSSSVFSP